MRYAGRTFIVVGFAVAVVAGAVRATAQTAPAAPAAPARPAAPAAAAGPWLPDPYLHDENWAKLPAGRKMGQPAGVDIDPDGKSVWIFERCGGTTCEGSDIAPIVKFDENGNYLKSFGAGMFIYPHGLTVDKDGNVWATEGTPEVKSGKGHQVFKFSPDGKVLMTLGKAGVAGETNDTFHMPSDVAIGNNGDIFVADGHNPIKTNMRIVKFTKDGTFIKAFAGMGSAPGKISDPHAIAFDSRGRLFVTDRGNQRMSIFDQEGNFIAAWKQFGRPSGVYISKDDTIYVADQNAGIRIGSAKDGTVREFIKAPEGVTRVADSVAADAEGNVYGGDNGKQAFMRHTWMPPPYPRKNVAKLYENDRVAIWDMIWPKGDPSPMHYHRFDQVGTYYIPGGRRVTQLDGRVSEGFTPVGNVSNTGKGTTHIEVGITDPALRAIFIALKSEKPSGLPPLPAGVAPAFPREGATQRLDTERVALYDYTLQAGMPPLTYRTPHDAVVVWLGDGEIKTTPKGGTAATATVKPGVIRYLTRGTTETLELVSGSPRMFVFELR